MAALIVCASLAVTMVVLTWLVFRIDSKVIGTEDAAGQAATANEL